MMSRSFTVVYVSTKSTGSEAVREYCSRLLSEIERIWPDVKFQHVERVIGRDLESEASPTLVDCNLPQPSDSTIYLQIQSHIDGDQSPHADPESLQVSLVQHGELYDEVDSRSDTSSASSGSGLSWTRSTSQDLYSTPWTVQLLDCICTALSNNFNLYKQAEALTEAIEKTTDPVSYIGAGLSPVVAGNRHAGEEFLESVIRNYKFFLESVRSLELLRDDGPRATDSAPIAARPMGVIEKILANAAVGLERPEVTPNQMICVKVDWVLTSELLWAGMEKTYNKMNRPRPHRNDRIWLAVDHTVDPRTAHLPKQQELMAKSAKFRDEAKIINYLPANTSIMHTDFTRERAQPGSIVVGSDSHTCSAGSMGALAVGFGAADTLMPLVTGETWFRVPGVCRINFVGSLPYGITGKDVILHILALFKRNTIAFQRAVEYGGPSLDQLSMDARFAIANMTTEFGGMGACFEADDNTARWIVSRRKTADRTGGAYFRPDTDAVYAETRTIDLSQVEFTMALYPNPDHVVPISAQSGLSLDGCFIGACTTTEEELILAALVLEAGLRSGLKPVNSGKRVVTPGSLIIIDRLNDRGLLEIYREAGFEINAPSCSYCVGINDVDVAQPGEVWLSSQNRNFKNRMGRGSIGNITCAAAVAASSFHMAVTDPRALLNQIDYNRYKKLLRPARRRDDRAPAPATPRPRILSQPTPPSPNTTRPTPAPRARPQPSQTITSRIQRFGPNTDTDAIIPAEFMPGIDNADLGSHCFEYFRPDFRANVAGGATIIVADHGFGSGSSREDAVRALLGAGVECVIAKGFAFICKCLIHSPHPLAI